MHKVWRNTYMAAALLIALGGCKEGEEHYSVAAEDNPIMLSVGIDNTPHSTGITRSSSTAIGSSENNYVAMTSGTKLQMRVEGDWKKSEAGQADQITKTSFAIVQAAENSEKYNKVDNYDPQLYWDDYGTADPANSQVGRTKGLAIYAVAVDGNANLQEITTWGGESDSENLLQWDTSDTNNSNFLEKDILVSNNLSGEGTPGRLTFDEYKSAKAGTDPEQARLVFRHVLSKITFRLKAGEGFSNYAFSGTTTVTLAKKDGENKNYCYTKGNINIKKGVAVHDNTTSAITTKRISTSTDNEFQVVSEEAIVYPGTPIGGTDANDIIAQLNADGNIYYVTAEKIRAAIDAKFSSDQDKYNTKAGYNYVFNVTIHKSKINVTATVVNWETVEAAEFVPAIGLSGSIGEASGNKFGDNTTFSFYRKIKDGTYSTKDGDVYKSEATVTVANGENDSQTFTMNPVLYWPDHETHYLFRGVYPCTGTPETDKPIVKDVTINSTSIQAIEVNNGNYEEDKFPSNFMIGAPEIKEANRMCGSSEHTPVDMTTEGICARSGAINLNFRYMMSQVIVNLKTSDDESSKVNLNNAEVSITNAYNKGYVGLYSRKVEGYDNTTNNYAMNSSSLANHFHDVIVPQQLENLEFKIKLYDGSDESKTLKAVYTAKIKDIPVVDGNNSSTAISEWKSGTKYTYNLKITKTEIKVTATLEDWVTKSSGDVDIWL